MRKVDSQKLVSVFARATLTEIGRRVLSICLKDSRFCVLAPHLFPTPNKNTLPIQPVISWFRDGGSLANQWIEKVLSCQTLLGTDQNSLYCQTGRICASNLQYGIWFERSSPAVGLVQTRIWEFAIVGHKLPGPEAQYERCCIYAPRQVELEAIPLMSVCSTPPSIRSLPLFQEVSS